MNRRRALRLSLVAVLGLVVLALVAGTTTAVVATRRPFPQRDGTVTVPGLTASVRVIRDERGVAQLYASDQADLFRAQGFVTASDRFFEMDLRRRAASGRLAELLGDADGAVRTDVLMRTLGLRRVAESELASLDPSTRAALQSYADGVNDYLRGRAPGEISLSYTLLARRHELPAIHEWTPVDSLAWLKAMAWDLQGVDRAQLGRARAFATVRDARRVDQLHPTFPDDLNTAVVADVDGAAPVPDGTTPGEAGTDGDGGGQTSPSRLPVAATPAEDDADDDLAAALAAPSATTAFQAVTQALADHPGGVGGGEAAGSNAWAVAGSRTASGAPLLADDLHLGTSVPGATYQIGLHCTEVSAACPYDVSGFGFAGLPGVAAGRNAVLAWGTSSLAADTSDLYLERLSADGRGYDRDGETVALSTREETVAVAGASSRTVTVRSTAVGPIVSDPAIALGGVPAQAADAAEEGGQVYAVSLAWTGLKPGRTMDGLLALARAATPEQVETAAALFSAPAEAIVYAQGSHIGMVAAGAVPTRRGGRLGAFALDGSWPLPGWTASSTWTGTVPADRLPRVLDPGDGLVVAANQPLTADSSGLTRDGDPGYRAQRIRDLVDRAKATGRPLTVADVERIQGDTRSPVAAILVPRLLLTGVDAFTEEAQDLLRGWDYTQGTDSAAAAYFNAVWATLLDLAFADELPAGARPDGGGRWVEVVRQLLQRPNDPWWDDKRTPGVVETRDAILARALQAARLRLTSTLGKDPSRWRWGKLHSVTLDDTAGSAGGVLGRWLDRGPQAAPGGSATVNSFAWDASTSGYAVTVAPAMRMVADLGRDDGSRWVNQSGQSGHPFDAHYGDQWQAWLDGESFPWPTSTQAVTAAAEEEQTLAPGE
ncbi:MAG: penicillin acylase family protein [Kineosporiaceae bacterium]